MKDQLKIEKLGFDPLSVEALKYYVYRLIDPYDGFVFYVGKGMGNRVYAHVNDALESPSNTDKLDHIRQIIRSGEEVIHEIVRHGMDKDTAFEVEGALIDIYGLEDLKNEQNGHYNNVRGLQSDLEIKIRYGSKPVNIEDPVFLAWALHFVPDKTTPEDLYEDARSSWLVKPDKHPAKYALAISNMIVREVYEIEGWDFFPVPQGNSKRKKDRYEFYGKIAPDDIREKYLYGNISSYIVEEGISKKTGKPIKIINQNLKWVNC